MYKALNNIQLSKNFHLKEFICKEGKNEVLIADGVIEKLQALRDYLGKPIIIVSGYRSPEYNKKINGSTKSQHMYGRAVDGTTQGDGGSVLQNNLIRFSLLPKLKQLSSFNF